MHKIQRVSKIFRYLFQVLFVMLPVFFVVSWMVTPLSLWVKAPHYDLMISYMPHVLKASYRFLPIATKIIAFLVSLIPLSIHLIILFFLISLFKLFEQGEIFSLRSTQYIKYIGYTLFVGEIVYPIYQALLSITLTWHNPPGERMVSISFSDMNLGILLVASLIILISWIMVEAYKINEEQKYTI